jgi:hypothetical protein
MLLACHSGAALAAINEEDGCLQLHVLNEKLLQGDVILSAWLIFIVSESDTGFSDNAYLLR